MWTFLTSTLSLVCGVLLMFVILLQRGRGGGLAGAFGGLGGQSAFGTKAGDVFTRITIVLAVVWVLLNAATIYAMRFESEGRFPGSGQVNKADENQSIAPNKTDDKNAEPNQIQIAEPPEKKDDKSEAKTDGKSIAPPADKAASDTKPEGAAPAADTKPEETKPAPSEGAEKKANLPAAEPAKPAAETPKEPGK